MAKTEEYIDTHFHVYDLERFSYNWLTPGMKIYRNYYPCDMEDAVSGTPVKHGVFIQCLDCSPDEAEWVLNMAERHPLIKGVVAGLDLTSSKLEEGIQRLLSSGLLKGLRHMLDLEKDDWITRDDVSKGLDTLEKFNLTFDLQVRPRHLKYVPSVVSKHPNLKFIINHIATPLFEGTPEQWRQDMAVIAKSPNVYCKISGLISELNPNTWREVDLQPFVDHVLAIFTPGRCLFGSDWPVFNMVDANYVDNYNVIAKALSSLNDNDQRKVFRENAIQFYNLNL